MKSEEIEMPNAYTEIAGITLSPEMELISLLTSSPLKDDYHRTGTAIADRLNRLIGAVGPEYAAKAVLLARHRLDARKITFLAAGELSQVINGQPWAANFYRRLPHRPDDVLSVIVYIRERYKKIPSRVKRGLGSYLRSCSEETLARYQWEKHFSMKLVDAVNLIHPKHSDPLRKLIQGTLPAPSKNGLSNGEVLIQDRNLLSLMHAVHKIDLMA